MSIDEQARAFLTELKTPRRRARQRLAEALRDAQQVEIDTPLGAVAAWRLGEGPAVLFVHGWQDDNALWSPLIQTLADMGIASVALDLPGHGFSKGEHCTPDGAAAAVAAVARELGPIDAVVTHSFGGPVIGWAIRNGFSARRLVLIASPNQRGKHWVKMAAEYGVAEDIALRAREIYTAASGGELANFDLSALKYPGDTLIFHSTDDEAVEWDSGRAIADAWPNAEFVLCEGLGHRMIAQDRGVIDRIVSFVA